MNPRVVPRLDLQVEFLPCPFIASRSTDILRQNFKIAQNLLHVEPQQRAWVLICDETYWWPTLDLIAGLRSQLGFIGGYYLPPHLESEERCDKSFLTLNEKKKLDDEEFDHLARLSQHYATW